MPIDPSISLQAVVPQSNTNFADTLQKAYSLRALAMQPQVIQSNLDTAAAARPGIQADSDLRVRAAAFKKWQTDNAPSFITDQGGTPKVDHDAFVNAAANAGFYQEAQSVAASDLANSQAALTIKRGNTASGDEVQDFTNKAVAHAATLVSALPADQQAAKWDQYSQFADSLVPGTGKMFGAYDPAKVSAARTATMSPLQQAGLGMQQAQQGKDFSTDLYDPTGRDPESTISQRAQADYIAANPGVPEADVKKLSAFDIAKRLPNGVASIERADAGARVSAPERIGAEMSANDMLGSQTVLNKGVSAVKNLLGSTSGNTWAGEKVNSIIQRYGKSNPQVKVLSDTLQEYKKVTGKDLDDSITLSGVADVLDQASTNLTSKINTASKVAKTSKLPSGTSPSGTVKMISKFGKMYDIPANDVDEAMRSGLKRVGVQ